MNQAVEKVPPSDTEGDDMSDNDNDFENKVREIMLPIQLPLSTIGQISLQKASHAIEELGTEQHPITSDNHPKLHADMFLASLHAELMGQDLGDWQIADKTDRLHLYNKRLNITVRALKKWKEGAPPAGRNKARQEDWMQPELAYQTDVETALNGMSFLLLWYLSGDRVDFMLTHPCGPGTFPNTCPTDLTMQMGVKDYEDRQFNKRHEEDFYVPDTNLVLPKTSVETKGKERQ